MEGANRAASSNFRNDSTSDLSPGEQPDVVGPLELNGLTRVVMRYSGRSNFVVWLYNEGGRTVDLLVNEIGRFSGSTAVPGDGGIYWLTVEGVGPWFVKVQ